MTDRTERAGEGAWGAWSAAIGNSLVIASSSLWAHKLRSLLTIFGIVTGIAAVVLIGTTLEYIRELAVKSTTQTIGADTFIISQIASAGNLSSKELSRKLRVNPEVYRREAELLGSRINAIAITAPTLEEISDVKAGNRMLLGATVTGSTPGIQSIRNIKLSGGRFFTEAESRRSSMICVIGHDLARELFPSTDPIDKSIRVKGRAFRVIGVQEKQGSSFGSSLDRTVYMPLLAFEKAWGSRRTVTVLVQPRLRSDLIGTQEQARAAMRALRRLRPKAADNFDLLVPESGRDFLARVVGIVSIAIVPISSVALIVAGIVVMNMMLVSVTERTRETGIRKSLGARNRDIFAEILFESTILTIIGGVAGLFISYIGAFGLSRAFDSEITISTGYALAALGVSAFVGLCAGFFPAFIASRMPPVEALRFET